MKISYTPFYGLRADIRLNETYVQPGNNFELKMEGGTAANGIDRRGFIQGTVRAEGVVLESAVVRLYLEETRQCVGEMVTDATGVFRFDGLNISKLFFLTTVDPIGKYEYLVSSRRKPTIEPSSGG